MADIVEINGLRVYGERFEDPDFVLDFARKKVDRSVRNVVRVEPALCSRRSRSTRGLYLIRCWAAMVGTELRGFITSSHSGQRQWFGSYGKPGEWTATYGRQEAVIGPDALV